LRFCFAGCSNANCFLHNLLGMAMHAGRQLSVEAQTEQERFRGVPNCSALAKLAVNISDNVANKGTNNALRMAFLA
jgi:hypothetical protein